MECYKISADCVHGTSAAERGNFAIVHEIDRELERGLSLHRDGNLKAAAEIYRKVLDQIPDQPDALYLMGCVAHQSGDGAGAVGLLERALLARPEKAEFHYALGNAHSKLGNYELAERHLRQATELGSRAEFHSSLGLLLKGQRRFAEAIAELEAAVRLGPGDAEALAALRLALASAGRNDEATAHLDRAAAQVGGDAGRLCDLADALQEAKDFDGATILYRRALEGDSTLPRAWFACGCAEMAREDFASAMPCFEQALRLRPDWLEARHNLGRALYEMGQVSPSFEEFKACAARNEKGAELARAMLAVIAPGAQQADNQMVLDVRQRWAKDLSACKLREVAPIQGASGKLKIGYVSSFFSSDNWMKPVWGLINKHDREEFEIYLFSDASQSEIIHGYKACEEDHWFETNRLSNPALAELIRDNGIQVLVDLNGYSNMQRLPMFMLRPAPVIVGWFNMYATTGIPCFDFLIGDGDVIPPDEEAFYSETICRTARSYLTFSVDYPVPPVAALPCIRSGQFTFGCFGSQYKITGEVVEAWSRILLASPRSRLLIKNKRVGMEAARDFLWGLFSGFGVAQGRVEFEGPESHFDFLRAYDRVDLALDTFPYNGGTTTTEAIWQGVPVVAFAGDRWASRTSASLLRTGGLGEFVADSLEGYVSLASRWANSPQDWPRQAALRGDMRRRIMASSVCDTPGFAWEMEEIYRACSDRSAAKAGAT
jgi:protein O-GlcNAc transferase